MGSTPTRDTRVQSPTAPVVVVLGVAGVGKTTIGELLAERLDLPFLDADSFHDAATRAQLHEGTPLDEQARGPWLDRINAAIRRQFGRGGVLACSALTRTTRERLTHGIDRTTFVQLTAPTETIHTRLATRTGHFVGPELLASQLATLEPPADALVVRNEEDPGAVVKRIVAALDL